MIRIAPYHLIFAGNRTLHHGNETCSAIRSAISEYVCLKMSEVVTIAVTASLLGGRSSLLHATYQTARLM